MGRETVLFKNEEKMSRAEAAQLLRTVADKIEQGKVVLKRGKSEVKLVLPAALEVEVKAEKEVGRSKTTKKLEIELEWRVGGKAEAGPMKIK
ncbi:MAG: amphi-Trp domain-containing protein [Desulfocapsaceae bacterium]